MGWRVLWRVTCETCRAMGPLDRVSHLAEAKAVTAGWLRGQVQGIALHLCKECREKPLPDWWPAEED